jgi:hypothetical protein
MLAIVQLLLNFLGLQNEARGLAGTPITSIPKTNTL